MGVQQGMGISTSSTVVAAPRDTVRGLARWAAQECGAGARVLNVGAGENVSGGLRPLLRRGVHLVGVDPDEAIERNRSLAERHRMELEEFSETHAGEFDVVLSVYVLEHVADPAAFAAACARVLRPGGSWFALTLNVRHYFGATTWLLSRLHVAHPALHLLKGDSLVEEHHFPTQYRLNSRAAVRRHCVAAGFEHVDFRCYDATERYQWYLPGPLAGLAPAWTRAAYAVGAPALMGHLTFRAVKAGDPSADAAPTVQG
jgi:2-polyprenyl-3-methyl-5-hydroxy-6-metoxy-1,4-benzoquinol methylase